MNRILKQKPLIFLLALCFLVACRGSLVGETTTEETVAKEKEKEKEKPEVLKSLEYYGDKIHFAKGKIETIKKHSKKQQKPIFLDFYTDWCQPCKWMEDDVFSQDHVAEFFNLNFINYKVNCEADDGIMTGIEYKITTYPTFIIVDSEGKELIRLEGMNAGSTLIRKGKEAIEEFEENNTPPFIKL